MEEKRRSRLEVLLIATVALLPIVLLVLYVVGYFVLSERSEWLGYPAISPDTAWQIDHSFQYR